jgi:hypothetical protein
LINVIQIKECNEPSPLGDGEESPRQIKDKTKNKRVMMTID